MQELVIIIEKHRSDDSFPGLRLLFLQQGIVPADGVALQARHRTAPVQDEY